MSESNILKAADMLKLLNIDAEKISYGECLKKIAQRTLKFPEYTERKIFAPFPYFGGKRDVAAAGWEFFGARIDNYIEPFSGGMAMLLGRPGGLSVVQEKLIETVNDKDALVINAWRALKYGNPAELAELVGIINSQQHLDALKRRVSNEYVLLNRFIKSDEEYFDPQLAAYWIVGMKNAIGAGFAGIPNSRTKVSPRTLISGWPLGSAEACFAYLRYRLTHVNLLSGDWHDCVGSRTRTTLQGLTAIFIDPPYPNEVRADCYNEDDGRASDAAADWAIETIHNDREGRFRIGFCGYRRLYDKRFKAEGWTSFSWKGRGYASQGNGRGRTNASEETIWFSPK